MFDQILEHTTPLGLPRDKAKQLLGMLVAHVFNPRRGGPAGFLVRLRANGLDPEVASWLGPGANLPAAPERVELALGQETVAHLSDKLGLPRETIVPAVALMLPDVMHELSEHGELPQDSTGIPDRFHHWFGDLGTYLDEFGHWGMAAANASAAALGASVGVVGDSERSPEPERSSSPRADGGSRLWPWIAMVAAVALAFIFVRYCAHGDGVRDVTPRATTSVNTDPAPPA